MARGPGWRIDSAAGGHKVTTPTLTGLGERPHLLSASVNLALHIDDVINHLVWENLQEVILVGHSFGGVPITGAADAVPERISKLAFLDAAVLHHGEAAFDLLPKAVVEARVAAAIEVNGCLALPSGKVADFGITKAGDVAFVNGRLTPHPLATYSDTLTLKSPVGSGLPITYVACTDPVYKSVDMCHQRARVAGWPVYELATGHDAMVNPLGTANLLEAISKI